jgi:hypothetical protein
VGLALLEMTGGPSLQCDGDDPQPHDGDNVAPDAAKGHGDDTACDVVKDRADATIDEQRREVS